jgi:CRISPR type I-E-associated protein CasB/Cse2
VSSQSEIQRIFREIKENGALRSELRRASSGRDLLGEPAADALRAAIRGRYFDQDSVAEECLILLAHRNVAEQGRAGSIAALWGGKDPLLSPLRFRRLLRATAGPDRLRQYRRALGLLKENVSPDAVIGGYLDLHSEKDARKFAYSYFKGYPVSLANEVSVTKTNEISETP